MALPIYNAISFQGILKGGRNNPWLVLVDENGAPKPYIIKLFTERDNNYREAIANEVIGNVLSKEFCLIAPKPALIEMDYNFEMTINDEDARIQYDLADQRIKFGCAEIVDANLYRTGIFTKRQISKMVEIDTLFAFDNLIRNSDRGQAKPNLLLSRKQAYLIDHELGFEINGGTYQDIVDKNWSSSKYQYHIFYDYLKRSRINTKKQYFNEFEEYLRTTNFNMINSYLDQLNHYGYSTDKHRYAIQYFNNVKNSSSIFVDLLRGII